MLSLCGVGGADGMVVGACMHQCLFSRGECFLVICNGAGLGGVYFFSYKKNEFLGWVHVDRKIIGENLRRILGWSECY